MGDEQREPAFQVVRNNEEQYSIWAAGEQPPTGWHPDGTVGSRQQCLDHIDDVWTDLRPRSARRP